MCQVLFFVLPLGRNNVFACKKESLSFFVSTVLLRYTLTTQTHMYILERLNYEGTIKMNLNFQEKKIVCVSYFGFCFLCG